MSCLSQILPTFPDIQVGFAGINLPGLPTFPKPFYGTVLIPSVVLPHWIVELQNTFYAGLTTQILAKIAGLLGLNYASLIPAIPGLSVTILDFIAGDIAKIKAAIMVAGPAFTSLFPKPLFGIVSAPDIEIAHLIQATYTTAVKSVVDVITSLVSTVTSFISNTFHVSIPGVTLPTFPTTTAIVAAIEAAIPTIPKIPSASFMMPSLTFPGFPPITIPSFGVIYAPGIQAIKMVPMIMIALVIGLLNPIVSFVNSIASYIGGFTWPKLCVDQSGFSLG